MLGCTPAQATALQSSFGSFLCLLRCQCMLQANCSAAHLHAASGKHAAGRVLGLPLTWGRSQDQPHFVRALHLAMPHQTLHNRLDILVPCRPCMATLHRAAARAFCATSAQTSSLCWWPLMWQLVGWTSPRSSWWCTTTCPTRWGLLCCAVGSLSRPTSLSRQADDWTSSYVSWWSRTSQPRLPAVCRLCAPDRKRR